MNYIKIGSGILFIIFGVIILVSHKKEEAKCDIKVPFISGFWLILLSEMGDKTQIASGLFATQLSPLFVLAGVVAALTILSIIAIYLGKFVMAKINEKTISIIAGTLFILIGIAGFFGIF